MRWRGRRPAAGDPGPGKPGSARPGSGDPGSVEASGPAAIAAGGDVINSPTHVDVYQAVPLPRAEEVDPPRGAPSNLRFGTELFVGRSAELAELDAALAGPGGAVVQAVHGLGGVGKSTLAARWARQHADAHVLTWWITADSAANITAGLAELAGVLVPEMTRSTPAAPGAVPVQERAAWARRWLASHAGWLVVLDNVTDPGDVAELVAGAPAGRFLITSRLREGWHDIAPALIKLDVLSESDALDLLRGVLTVGRPASGPGAGVPTGLEKGAELCAELGWLPLAVKQAAAFVRQAHLTPEDYLELYRANPAAIYDRAARGSDSATIALIWRITLDTLAESTPLAGELLRIMAWWAPETIPRTLPTPITDPVTDPVGLATALGELAAYNMITLSPETISVHRLVQAVARTPDPRDPHRQPADIDTARHHATTLLHQATPADTDDPAGWPTWRSLLPHIDALAEHADPDTDTTTTSLLLDSAALFLHEQGAIARAIAYYQRALASNQRLHGPDHPDTLTSRNNLAGAYYEAGDLERAIPLLEATLTDRERVLGNDHPNTLASRNNLAGAYYASGDLGRAIPLLKATLTDQERVLGDDHPDTLISRSNLAYAYQEAGDLGRAIPLLEATLTDQERVLGNDHPRTLASRSNLAGAYQEAGDLGRAIPLHQQTLTDRERVLGNDHPDTLISRSNLAYAYQEAGDLERAIPLLEATLTDQERVLGNDHPRTLTSRSNLARAYQEAGDLGRAIPLHQQTLTDQERVLGNDHPHTLTSRNNLAHAYQAAGDLKRAIPLLEATLTDRERVLGNDHPHTLTSRNNLAGAYYEAGDLERAIPLLEATLTDRERVLGNDHPNTLISRSNLAGAYQEAGDLGRAIPLLEATLAGCRRVLGEDHPLTKTVRENLEGAG
ncbi:tetratricopeptide repeat protein [Actinomadura sp. NEAU-AAG5]|uniref:Tetratricopeptide repeat protein n=1 Tax=Actinomadura litoris TaxID=2678616 RepID=A0A7K1L914_9ACTN|nr:tetratricopeptide repeat protein [Actinomadura litoris]